MVAFKNSGRGGIVDRCSRSVSAEGKWNFPIISLFDSYHQNLIFWLFSFKCFTISWGTNPRVFQREVNATLLAVWRSDGLKMERGNCPGFWPLSPVWSTFHSDQWEGTVPGTSGWETAVTHLISTIENRWTDFLQIVSIWRKPNFGYIDFSIFEPSAFSSLRGRAWVGPTWKFWGAKKSKCSSNVLLPLLTYTDMPKMESSDFKIS